MSSRKCQSASDISCRLRKEVFWSLFLLLLGVLLGQLTGDISEGILPRWLHQYLPLGHHGFVCPFCGGVRSFVYFCRLDFSGAMHSSILGILGAVYMVLTLPLRIICCRCKSGSCIFSFYRMLDRFESCDVFLMITAGCLLFQLALHYAGFIWFPAAAV